MDNNTIVIDNGSGYMKVGLNTHNLPAIVFPTVVGNSRNKDVNQTYVGDEAFFHESELSIYRPFDHGHISDWDLANNIWDYAISCVDPNKSVKSALLTEPPLCSISHRKNMGEIFFENFGFESINISVSGLMSIYAAGLTTGLVLDIGEGVTQCIPIFDGYIEKNSVIRSDFGGEELTMFMQKLICDIGYNMTTRKSYEYVKIMKETLCFCSLNPPKDQLRDDLTVTYTLPDGDVLRDGYSTIEISHERFYVPEALFNPLLCHRDNLSISDIVCKSILSCPIENRKILSSYIILSGGCSLFPNLVERLEREIKNNSPENARSAVKVHAHENRGIMAWCGAQIFSQPELRDAQRGVWVSKDEYEEIGDNIFLIKATLKLT
ncbi:actin-like protein, putative [Plasmodium berghei]|uniref:Actin-like protein, putative n=2 Tax=Plasmodium berghei TaxID=5821 RepID=A0A509AKH9_PLABA|nr:actin-like protein, putative [Plasmodium berghei ANKA]CXI45638.1 actin-like protein, putative [Plasmodium berghei]SCM22698.1 actin-like protein, putative [Plasmodium berghei]SCN25603.1 actin-like protein, putative [Plasmodium berghei]SCO60550.1 actin-like protein, putative [Plasmodium berghei]SCO62304.1 actin-like protein, putative [Plasmodium berghei]|eukprot:XP_034421720.1 actin-like protein, putative [Plasmodium berghei ANKA]